MFLIPQLNLIKLSVELCSPKAESLIVIFSFGEFFYASDHEEHKTRTEFVKTGKREKTTVILL